MRYADLSVSDSHIGSKMSIMFPDKNVDYKPNEAQKWMFKVWENNFLADIDRVLNKFKVDYVHVSFMGGK